MNFESEYATYRDWKGWSDGPAVKASDYRYFDGEMKRARLGQARSVLEIGFGTGTFLAWGASRGVSVVGLEIIPELVKHAEGSGQEVYLWNLVTAEDAAGGPLAGRQFDAVVAWDVFEHLTVEEGRRFLNRVAGLLRPGGRLVLRFPNGESPFYVPVQNGDYTHKMHVSRLKLEHLSIGNGFRVDGYFNAFRIADRRRTAWAKQMVYLVRDVIELAVGHIYYGKRRPLDPVATAVLVRE